MVNILAREIRSDNVLKSMEKKVGRCREVSPLSGHVIRPYHGKNSHTYLTHDAEETEPSPTTCDCCTGSCTGSCTSSSSHGS
jgi:hypothetical protein